MGREKALVKQDFLSSFPSPPLSPLLQEGEKWKEK